MGKLIHGLLSIKGLCNIGAYGLIPHAVCLHIHTHTHTHAAEIHTRLVQLIIYLFWSLSVFVSPPVEHLQRMSKHESQTSHVNSPSVCEG